MVEDPADDNGIVRRIVVAEAVAGVLAAPGHAAAAPAGHGKTGVQLVENFFQIVRLPARRVRCACARASAAPGAPFAAMFWLET